MESSVAMEQHNCPQSKYTTAKCIIYQAQNMSILYVENIYVGWTRQTHSAIITSLLRQNDVILT